MNETSHVEVADVPLPETERELVLLLEALHALNDTLAAPSEQIGE